MSRAAEVWRVVLDMPLRRPFDYLAPKENSITRITPGVRVRVPFGAQRLIGIATQAASESAIAPERLKPILDVLDSAPVLDESAAHSADVGGGLLPPPDWRGLHGGAAQGAARRGRGARAAAGAGSQLPRDARPRTAARRAARPSSGAFLRSCCKTTAAAAPPQ